MLSFTRERVGGGEEKKEKRKKEHCRAPRSHMHTRTRGDTAFCPHGRESSTVGTIHQRGASASSPRRCSVVCRISLHFCADVPSASSVPPPLFTLLFSIIWDRYRQQCHACIGGTSIGEDTRKLDHGQHIVSGTPGRVFDMIKRGNLRVSLQCIQQFTPAHPPHTHQHCC